MTCLQFVTLTKDLILVVVALVGSVVAIMGLNTWRRQLRAQFHFELSRRILVDLFKYRDAINRVRHPAIMSYETPSPPAEKAKDMTPEQISFYGISAAYQARWDQVYVERSELRAGILEAEAVWGSQLKTLFKALSALEYELIRYIRLYLEIRNPDTDEETKEANIKLKKDSREILYDDLSEEGDTYRKEFQAGIEKIEQYLKDKMEPFRLPDC